jgi:hypothetical protein
MNKGKQGVTSPDPLLNEGAKAVIGSLPEVYLLWKAFANKFLSPSPLGEG